MVGFKIKVTRPDFSRLRQMEKVITDVHYRAAMQATDIAAHKTQRHVQAKIKGVGLGRLSNAVGYTSSLRKRQKPRTPYGAIFARGGDETLAGGALEAYSKGVVIRARGAGWLAFATDAVPKMVSAGGRRRRNTPKRYKMAGLESRIGKLIFRLIKPNLALLVVRKVSLSPKTGQAKALGKGRPRTRVVPEKDTVAFVLIKQTRRAKRFDKNEIVRIYANRVPDYLARIIRQIMR